MFSVAVLYFIFFYFCCFINVMNIKWLPGKDPRYSRSKRNGKKSIAFTITIQPTENMDDAELLKIQEVVIANVEKKCNAKIRDK